MFEPRLQVGSMQRKNRKNEIHPNLAKNDPKKLAATCQRNISQYLLNTTLHGLKYVGDRTITRFERFFSVSMFVLVICISSYFITNVWNKWNACPVITIQSAVSTSVKDIPFPSVTICNMNLAQKSQVIKIPRYSEEYLVLQNGICQKSIDDNVTNSVVGRWSVFRKVLLNVSQKCNDMLISCRFGGIEHDCMKLFSSVLSDGGLCCQFNGLHRKFMMRLEYKPSQDFNHDDYRERMANRWDPETGFSSEELKLNPDGYPRPAVGAGSKMGLSLVLNAAINEYYCSSTSGFGFKVVLHSPHELPQIDEYGLGIANGFESRIVANPMISGASDAVRRTPMRIRQCVYQDENFLTYYRVYSRENCESECVTKIYLENCNCILYFMPRHNYNISICSYGQSECVNHVKNELQLGLNDSFKCECFYGCDAIKFDMGFSATPIYSEAPIIRRKELNVENVSILHVYYQRGYYRGSDKEELIGFTEFLSNIGGLLGLFMGFSVFSIIEVLYFLSIRPYCQYLKDPQKRAQSMHRVFRRFNNIKLKAPANINTSFENPTIMNNVVLSNIK